ncbi:uncharacterized protein LOC143294812 [Babylonia areolata]|uniref:uncharacterized protein LOC143294812 n=1 Tax=Babylonia areolata TaxID=304850 RepID=UPI003FD3794B
MKAEMKLNLLFLLVELLRAVRGSSHGSAGCEEGWLNYGHFCYYFGVSDSSSSSSSSSYQQSRQDCEGLDARLASLWTREERTFVTDTLWQPSVGADQFAWFGLHGTPANAWAYEDNSDVIMGEGVLTSSGGEPADRTNKCGAFTGTGSLAFLDCQGIHAQGFICKKALPRVFATSDLLNHTLLPDAPTPPRGAQLFERVWPPLLLTFPNLADYLAEDDADSETGCAFRCYNVHGCKAFQVTCITSDMCKSVTCTFYK